MTFIPREEKKTMLLWAHRVQQLVEEKNWEEGSEIKSIA